MPTPGRLLWLTLLIALAAVAPPAFAQVCVPATPQNCALVSGPEPPPPVPPPPGPCTFQIEMKEVTVTQGQGVSEGNLELSVVATAGAGLVRWPTTGQQLVAPNGTRVVDRLVASHAVPAGTTKVVPVCAVVTEQDRGGINGKSDVGVECEQVQLTCPAVPAPVPSFDVNLRAPLCQGNRKDKNGVCKKFHGETRVKFHVSLDDEDGDGVPSPVDMTPKPGDDACRGQKGRAVVLYSEYGTSDFNDLIGLVGMGIDRMVEGYDFVALVMDPLRLAGFTIRPDTLARADVIEEPTLDGLLSAMRAAVSRGFDVSLIIQAHGGADTSGNGFFTTRTGTISDAEIRINLGDPAVSGTCDIPIRMVHSLACYANEVSDAWIDVGAKVAGGARFTSFYPQEQNGFARGWNAGDRFGATVGASVDPVVRLLNSTAVQTVGTFHGCIPPLFSVLLLNPCAEAFFTTLGPAGMSFANNGRSDYDPTLTGLANMDIGSEILVQGDNTITKFTGGLTWP